MFKASFNILISLTDSWRLESKTNSLFVFIYFPIMKLRDLVEDDGMLKDVDKFDFDWKWATWYIYRRWNHEWSWKYTFPLNEMNWSEVPTCTHSCSRWYFFGGVIEVIFNPSVERAALITSLFFIFFGFTFSIEKHTTSKQVINQKQHNTNIAMTWLWKSNNFFSSRFNHFLSWSSRWQMEGCDANRGEVETNVETVKWCTRAELELTIHIFTTLLVVKFAFLFKSAVKL